MNDKVIVGDINSYIEDNIGYIILDNPNRLNAISLSMWEKIGFSLDKFMEDKNLRCIVLRGKGNKSFSAGADISEFKDNRSQEKAVLQYDNVSKNTLNRIQNFPKPTIALVLLAVGVLIVVDSSIAIRALCARKNLPANNLPLSVLKASTFIMRM